ncbi:glycosyltransferase family 2 protein [Clostridium manihotivorum]|uniref:Glycosyltransferase family 2 protein n=1 Tax=Clostridium manihotivorum TaxID=2320868 RepID=A0A410DSJ8_9CLOT|nr:glycosyltransferase family 2 protein [Clostridium manihotivorum]QAA32020.1 glycosyltransferase family 2 protein [Clostridium manihotivorum]
MINEPLVFIVILNFNSYTETLRCLESVLDNDYSNYQVVVVDNNSTDASKEILDNHSDKFKLLTNSTNLGYANGNNVGIKYALENNADYVCILNNDVEVEKNFLSELINYMNVNENVGIAGPCICDFQERDNVQSMGANINLFTGLAQAKGKNTSYTSIKEDSLSVDYLGGACFVARKEVFKKIGLIPEMYFLFFEETEFCLKAKKAGYKLICLNSSRVYHKQSATISKYKGLSYFFLNRNRIVFMRRNAKLYHKVIFSFYIIIETFARKVLKNEPLSLFRVYLDGLKADVNNINMNQVNSFFKKS